MSLHIIDHGLQVFQIYKKQVIIISDPVDDAQDIALQIVELQDSGHQKRAHLGDGCAQRHALPAVNIPESHRITLIIEAVLSQTEPRDSFLHVGGICSGKHESGQIALYVRHEDRDSHLAEGLRHDTGCHGLAGTGRSGDQAVSVCHAGQQEDSLSRVVVSHPDFVITKHFYPPQ